MCGGGAATRNCRLEKLLFHVKHSPSPLSPEQFAEQTGALPPILTRLQAYVDVLLKWQRKINLIGRGTVDDVWRRHLLDSAQLLPLLPSQPVVLDMGSGAGFPGLVLAIMTDCTVHLVESDGRKCAFLRQAARLTGTENVHVHDARMEALPPFPVDVIGARALTGLGKLLDLAEPFLGPQTVCLFLKGQKAQDELTEALKTRTMEVEMINSQTDPSGTILKLSNIHRNA
ncbi:MAG TPA: 16S rRNA (guanine(527)-N(7))-methyltransferase RsmG [Rhodospirillales bacterium]|nr:16S rRNA (guanine(527)-N(7))-methyltransferase RsmG [Rhodospirillales bacterium]